MLLVEIWLNLRAGIKIRALAMWNGLYFSVWHLTRQKQHSVCSLKIKNFYPLFCLLTALEPHLNSRAFSPGLHNVARVLCS